MSFQTLKFSFQFQALGLYCSVFLICEENFENLGYSKILRRDNGTFPDFIMERKGEVVKVELETLSSNFIVHNHDKKEVDEVVCIEKDIEVGVPIIEVSGLCYVGGKVRISATVDEQTIKDIQLILKKGRYRNKSHVIEDAIKLLKEKVV